VEAAVEWLEEEEELSATALFLRSLYSRVLIGTTDCTVHIFLNSSLDSH